LAFEGPNSGDESQVDEQSPLLRFARPVARKRLPQVALGLVTAPNNCDIPEALSLSPWELKSNQLSTFLLKILVND
jgi:hypothetical protein